MAATCRTAARTIRRSPASSRSIVDHGARDMMEQQRGRLLLHDRRRTRTTRSPRCRPGVEDDMISGIYRFAAAGERRARRACGCSARARSCARSIAAARPAGDGLERRSRSVERHQLRRARARGARDRALEPAASRAGRRAPSHLARSLPRRRADRRGDRLRACLSAVDRRVPGRAVRRAGHRRLRAQRHARGAAPLLRGRPPSHRGRGPGRAGAPRRVPPAEVAAAIERYGIDTESAPSWLR